jgi:hypothetical protein
MGARTQRGTTTVEFAIVGAVLLALIFAVIEFGRILFSMSVLNESARRGARVAAVCAVGDAGVSDAAVFVSLPGFSATNVVTEYLDQDGAPLGDPAGADYTSIRYVRVRVVNVSFPIAIPFITPTFDAPEFSATLPRESLGVPRFGAVPVC